MMDETILIAGAGICGLVVAKELTSAGKKVILLEANDRAGGRILTLKNKFSHPAEAGAEFIHGKLPHTLDLLKEAGIDTFKRKGMIYRNENGEIISSRNFIEHLHPLLRKLNKLEKDISFAEFLSTQDIDEKDRRAAIQFAEGFDAADTNRLSSFSIRDEWKGQNSEAMLQINNGYGALVDYLVKQCKENNCPVHLSTIIKQVRWKKDSVTALCADGKSFEGNKIIITVPLGILTAAAGEKGHIEFEPSLPEITASAKKMGYGPVVKVILEFKNVLWANQHYEGEIVQLPGMDFLVSEEYFPTWWVYCAQDAPILTGWTGGPKAEALKNSDEKEILTKALASLASALSANEDFLREQLVNYSVQNWGAHPFSKGAYSYNTIETESAKKILTQPVEQTIYFAGEALNEEDSSGTVEAAIASGMQVVKKVLGK